MSHNTIISATTSKTPLSHNALLRQAALARQGLRSPVSPHASFASRLGGWLVADTLEVMGRARPTPHVQARLMQPWSWAAKSAVCDDKAAPVAEKASAAMGAALMALPARVGAFIGLVVDAIAILATMALGWPGIVVHAVWAALRPQGLLIDVKALSADVLEKTYQDMVQTAVQQQAAKRTDGIAKQFKLDVGRQRMRLGDGPRGQLVRLPKDVAAAAAALSGLLQDATGHVDKAWLAAVTECASQGLLNGAYAHLLEDQVATFQTYACALDLNGDTAFTIRRLAPDLIAIRADMRAPAGVQFGVLDGPHASQVRENSTPLHLRVEAHVAKPVCPGALPGVRVKTFGLKRM